MRPSFTIKILVFFALILQSCCGFQVIYDQNKSQSYVEQLSSIKIQKKRNRSHQELKNNLYNIFNPQQIESNATTKYILSYDINESISSTFTTETGSSGRNKITLNVNYLLKEYDTKEIISQGYVNVNDNYDISDNRYATYTTKEYVKTNLLNIVARDIRNAIVNDLTLDEN